VLKTNRNLLFTTGLKIIGLQVQVQLKSLPTQQVIPNKGAHNKTIRDFTWLHPPTTSSTQAGKADGRDLLQQQARSFLFTGTFHFLQSTWFLSLHQSFQSMNLFLLYLWFLHELGYLLNVVRMKIKLFFQSSFVFSLAFNFLDLHQNC